MEWRVPLGGASHEENAESVPENDGKNTRVVKFLHEDNDLSEDHKSKSEQPTKSAQLLSPDLLVAASRSPSRGARKSARFKPKLEDSDSTNENESMPASEETPPPPALTSATLHRADIASRLSTGSARPGGSRSARFKCMLEVPDVTGNLTARSGSVSSSASKRSGSISSSCSKKSLRFTDPDPTDENEAPEVVDETSPTPGAPFRQSASRQSASFRALRSARRSIPHKFAEWTYCMTRSTMARMKTKRTTVTLSDTYLLRGTTSATLLEGCGRRLRSTAGGIGSVSADGEEEFRRSFQVPHVDYFLSHSWHARWWLKYLTLVFYFNLPPANIAALTAGLIVCCMRYIFDFHFWPGRATGIPMYCFFAGVCAFMGTLGSWHRIAERIPFFEKSVFLDKVCIHQTDVSKKEQGIKSIGGILQHSHELLVAWDPTYFQRLWCTYEMSAFMHAQGKSRSVVIVPVQSGGLVAVLIFSEMLVDLFVGMLSQVYDLKHHHMNLMYSLIWCVICLIVELQIRVYIRNVKQLSKQLDLFSVRQTECFCCNANHIHPITQSDLPCDREVVYASIVHWQGTHDVNIGLNKFDDMIRGSFKEYVGRTLGAASAVPYRYAMAVGVIACLMGMDRGLAQEQKPATMALHCINWFLQQPLAIGFLIHFVRKVPYEEKSNSAKLVINVSIALANGTVFYAFNKVSDRLFTKPDILCIAWMLFEFCLVWALFWRKDDSTRFIHNAVDLDEQAAATMVSFCGAETELVSLESGAEKLNAASGTNSQ